MKCGEHPPFIAHRSSFIVPRGFWVERIALISVHTSPLAALGGRKAGGMNVYVRESATELARLGYAVDIFTPDDGTRPPVLMLPVGD